MVEDEYYIADDLRRTIVASGGQIVGPCSSVAKAREALDRAEFDCAVIDLNLNGENAVPIAERLIREGHSFAIATGYDTAGLPDELQKMPRIEKPFDPRSLLQLVGQLSCARTGASAG